MPEASRVRILLVDDNVEVLDALQRQLRTQFDVTATCGANEAIRLVVSSEPFAVVVSDLRMPGMDGVTLTVPYSSIRAGDSAGSVDG